MFTTKPVLAAPDLDKEFRVEADVSNYATGGVLSMKCCYENLEQEKVSHASEHSN